MPSPKRRNHDVASLTPFKDTNKYARNEAAGRLYVVYSYRDTWPMFVFDRQTGTWYENEDKYSVTTSKHRTQCVPYDTKLEQANTRWLVKFIEESQAETTADLLV